MNLLPGDSVRVPSGLRGVQPIGVVTYLRKRTGLVDVTIVTGDPSIRGTVVTRKPEDLKRYSWR